MGKRMMKSEEIMNRVAFPIVVSGASGAGKTTLCHELVAREPRITFSVSATTRKARGGEKNGVDYFFVSEEEFESMKGSGDLVEWAEVHGESYGTPRKWLDERLSEGVSVLLDIDVQGGVQIMDTYPGAVAIFVVTPSMKILEERLRKRKSDSPRAIETRLGNAVGELEYMDKYTYIVVNDTVEAAVSKMACIVSAERSKRERLFKRTSWKEFVGL
jgi:guanylate kinase